jgi:hypothetical protein
MFVWLSGEQRLKKKMEWFGDNPTPRKNEKLA